MPHSQHLHEPRRGPQIYVDAPLPRRCIHLFAHLPPCLKIALSATLICIALLSAKQTFPFVPSPKNRRNSRSDAFIRLPRVLLCDNDLVSRGRTSALAHIPKLNLKGKGPKSKRDYSSDIPTWCVPTTSTSILTEIVATPMWSFFIFFSVPLLIFMLRT